MSQTSASDPTQMGETDSPEREEILMQSTVTVEGRPSVQLRWGPMTGQLTPEEAREHARRIFETAEAAVHDAAMYRWLLEKAEVPREHAMEALFELRRFRGDSTREDWRGGEAETDSPG